MLPIEAYLRERDLPCDRVAFLQRWRDLLFLHFSIEPDAIRSVVPHGLEIDTYPDAEGNEKAWIGLVPFRMEGVRHPLLPPIPTTGAFPETNVRTYVHRKGRPGVWFFSLDAASTLACQGGRRLFYLPYREALMKVEREGDDVNYESTRRNCGANLAIQADVSGIPGPAIPGTLEFFLVERYLLFSTNSRNWFGGNVHHAPYQVREATTSGLTETLVAAAGIPPSQFVHTMFVDGVDVRIGKLIRLK